MKPGEKEGKKWCRMRRSVNEHHHPKGTTLGERSGPNEDSHKTNEGLYERKNTHRLPYPQDEFSFHRANHNSSPTFQVQDAYLGLVQRNMRSLRSRRYIQVNHV